jgi:diguanylate cyclase (GGDEF)-like protein
VQVQPIRVRPLPLPRPLVTGVRDPGRLKAVADAELAGHLGDPELDAVVATLRLACAVPIAVVNIVSANQQTYPAEVGIGAPCTTVPDELSFCAEVVDTGLPLSVPDAAAHPVYAQNPMVREGVIGSYAGVPLVDDGVVLGSVSIFDAKARDFTPDDLEVLRLQAALASSVLGLRRSARTDVLTGLPNRASYVERLTRALRRLERHPGGVAVMYLDIDGFKGINDELGHEVGDQVLRELARRLDAVMRPSDTLARFGGDEFVVLCSDLERAGAAAALAGRMVAAAEVPWERDGLVVRVGISIGIAETRSAHADPAALLRDADEAMYLAKELPGSQWCVAAASTPPQRAAPA